MKKGILTLVFAVAFLFTGVMGVNAEEYGLEALGKLATEGGSLEIKAGDTIKVGEDVYVGDSEIALMNVTEGTATLTNKSGRIEIVLKGTAEVKGSKVIMQLPLQNSTLSIDLIVNEGSTLNVNGRMALPTGTKGTLVNNGTVNINGSLEVRADATYTGEGVTNLTGNFVIYGETNTLGTAKITLGEKGTVYSNADVTANLTYVEGFEAAPLETKVYKSITDEVGEKTFTNGYTTVKTEVEEPTEEPTEEVKDEETKDEVKDEEKNPQTSDGIVLTFVALAISGAVAIIAKKKLA